MNLVLSPEGVQQPRLYEPNPIELYVAVASLSLGGAERIVLDWAERIYPRYRVHIIVLRDRVQEWRVPPFVRVTRLGGAHLPQQLEGIGRIIASDKNPVCLCHLLSAKERRALAQGGAIIVPVFHNAKDGWTESVTFASEIPYAIAVSESCAEDLRTDGWRGVTSVIRHIPPARIYETDVRAEMRRVWNIPSGATVIGMIGALKPQKNYVLALRVVAKLLQRQEVYLVIIGGPVNTSVGRETWDGVVAHVNELGIRRYVAMPGFIPDAARFLSAFDCVLNTSLFEGLSIATLEALLAGIPVIASRVGGQGEVAHPRLSLMPITATEDEWADRICETLNLGTVSDDKASWEGFPSYRLWTLASIAGQVNYSPKTLFVTANLSSGGAQRSLVNLVTRLRGQMDFEVMVAGKSSLSYFLSQLVDAGVQVWRAGEHWSVFDFAENIARKVVSECFGTICFWNVDPRVKLLLVKAFAFSGVRFVDVSPGLQSSAEMDAMSDFQELVVFGCDRYVGRVDAFVHKYAGEPLLGDAEKNWVIKNGVPVPSRLKSDYHIRANPRIAVVGRIAPTKFLLEIVSAMRILWKRVPTTELHVFGAAEHYDSEYLDQVMVAAGDEIGSRIVFNGPCPDVVPLLPDFDGYLVLGKKQGCPNALLEALSVGLPVVGNDDGGTREQIIDDVTGLLVQKPEPILVADALYRLISDRTLARRLGEAGRKHVQSEFSMEKMTSAYKALLLENDVGTQKLSQCA